MLSKTNCKRKKESLKTAESDTYEYDPTLEPSRYDMPTLEYSDKQLLKNMSLFFTCAAQSASKNTFTKCCCLKPLLRTSYAVQVFQKSTLNRETDTTLCSPYSLIFSQ